MYTKMQFGKDLKEKLGKKESVLKIGEWAHSIYMKHLEEIDLDFRDILLALNTMELGPEFAFDYQGLEQIADDLIAGKDVKL